MQVPYENRFCSLLLFEVREINRFLEICHRDPRKILRASRYSILETRASNLDTRFSIASRIEDRVSSRDCQLTFARYCSHKPHNNTSVLLGTVLNIERLCESGPQSIKSIAVPQNFLIRPLFTPPCTNRKRNQMCKLAHEIESTNYSRLINWHM